jgi:transcriptional regulator with XRE-family HTH domain
MTQGPTGRRRQLGRELRKARMSKGLTQASVAKQLECGQAKINKIETTLVTISMDELDKMIRIYGIGEEKAAELIALASLDHVNGPRRTSASVAWSAFDQLHLLEQDAREILCVHSDRIPGPLQSEQYMLQQHHPDTKTTPDVVHLLRERKARARIFTIDDPPRYRAILSESAVRRMPGGTPPRLVVDQLEHMLDLMLRHPQLELRILTFQAKIGFVDTDFQLLHFEGEEPDFAYIESAGGARKFERPEEIKAFEDHWYDLHTAALDRAATVQFMEQLVKESKESWKTPENG